MAWPGGSAGSMGLPPTVHSAPPALPQLAKRPPLGPPRAPLPWAGAGSVVTFADSLRRSWKAPRSWHREDVWSQLQPLNWLPQQSLLPLSSAASGRQRSSASPRGAGTLPVAVSGPLQPRALVRGRQPSSTLFASWHTDEALEWARDPACPLTIDKATIDKGE